MQPTLFFRSELARATWCALCIANTRSDRAEDRLEMGDDVVLSTDHQTKTAIKTKDTAARADIDIVDALRRESFSTIDIISVIGVAAVDDDVARFHQR